MKLSEVANISFHRLDNPQPPDIIDRTKRILAHNIIDRIPLPELEALFKIKTFDPRDTSNFDPDLASQYLIDKFRILRANQIIEISAQYTINQLYK